jgi:lipopolysaccharide transport system permease protein
MNHVITILLFTSPVFFSIDRIPSQFRPLMFLNPIAYLLEDARSVMIFGKYPNWKILAFYTVIGFFLMIFGYWTFQKTRKGFADVL